MNEEKYRIFIIEHQSHNLANKHVKMDIRHISDTFLLQSRRVRNVKKNLSKECGNFMADPKLAEVWRIFHGFYWMPWSNKANLRETFIQYCQDCVGNI